MGRSFRIITAFLLLATFGCSERQGIGPGDYPYEFSLSSVVEPHKRVSLRGYRGKVVVLNFWASWCTPCLDEIPALERLSQRYPEEIAVIGVGIDDDKNALSEIVKRLGVSFPVVLDTDGALKAKYQVRGVPETFLIGKDGRLVLFPDRGGELTVRVLGDRTWDEPPYVDALKALAAR